MKVIIAGGGTGGHLFPAVALGDELMRQRPENEVLFVGTTAGLEASWLPTHGYKYVLLGVHGLRGHGPLERVRASVEFVRAVLKALGLLRVERPALVVSAGGYAAAPMGMAAILRRVPLLLMEQNTRPGLVNRMLWRFAARICVSFDETARYLKSSLVEVTGNPIRFKVRSSSPGREGDGIQILVLGGSTGAHRLNVGVLTAFKNLEKGVIKLRIVHQTGVADEGMVRTAYSDIALDAEVVAFIDDMASALAQADLVVARSGGNTVSELALAGRASILVPYPFHRDQQQLYNARVLERIDSAIIVRDDEQLGANLAQVLGALIGDRARLRMMGEAARKAARPGAAAAIARACFEIAKPAMATA
jgi:UDP-N-acetylglucosamine--N-acetylmuramyl-(pentapeptide) pyrophosphoryl-undecaprenol N-acetylglucosamine transferase